MLRRWKAFFNFENFCEGCELYYELLVAMGLLELYNLKRDRIER
jgi:hypothetical protein